MAITKQHEKGEVTEADLEKAYTKARTIGLALVEKYAREALRKAPEFEEFVMSNRTWGFTPHASDFIWMEVSEPLLDLFQKWDGVLKLTGEPMRFTADGPVRREW